MESTTTQDSFSMKNSFLEIAGLINSLLALFHVIMTFVGAPPFIQGIKNHCRYLSGPRTCRGSGNFPDDSILCTSPRARNYFLFGLFVHRSNPSFRDPSLPEKSCGIKVGVVAKTAGWKKN